MKQKSRGRDVAVFLWAKTLDPCANATSGTPLPPGEGADLQALESLRNGEAGPEGMSRHGWRESRRARVRLERSTTTMPDLCIHVRRVRQHLRSHEAKGLRGEACASINATLA